MSYVIDKDRELSTPLLLTPHTLSPERENGDYLPLLTEAMQGKNRASPQVESHHREAERILQNSEVLFFSSSLEPVSSLQIVLHTLSAFQFLTTFWGCSRCRITIKENESRCERLSMMEKSADMGGKQTRPWTEFK